MEMGEWTLTGKIVWFNRTAFEFIPSPFRAACK